MDNVAGLVAALDEVEEDEQGDPTYATAAPETEVVKPQPATRASREVDPPTWATEGLRNLRGRLPLSHCHFTAVVQVSVPNKPKAGAILEALVDSAGAKSMIDLKSAEMASLPLVRSTKERPLGWYYGPSGDPVAYAGIVQGPVRLLFAKDVFITVPELKVVHSKEPLVLIGTDAMSAEPADGGWKFAHVGYDPKTEAGVVQFSRSRGKDKLRTLQLLCWPTQAAPAADEAPAPSKTKHLTLHTKTAVHPLE